MEKLLAHPEWRTRRWRTRRCAPGGIRTPNLLIRRSIRRVRDGPRRSQLGVGSCVMIFVDRLILDRVAVSVAVNASIMWCTMPTL